MKRKAATEEPWRSVRQKTSVSSHDDDDDDDGSTDPSPTPLTIISSTSATPTHKTFASDLKTIRCAIFGCNYTCNRPARLRAHMNKHAGARPFHCQHADCSKAYTEKKHLQQHLENCHAEGKIYACSYEGCAKVFTTSTRLKRHAKVHVAHDRFRCEGFPPCKEVFRKKDTLERHVRKAHLDLPAYPCSYSHAGTGERRCQEAYQTANALRLHVAMDHGETLDNHIKNQAHCQFCESVFPNRSTLNNHVETQHGAPVPCEWSDCDKIFSRRSNMLTHVRSAHHGNRWVCGQVDMRGLAEIADWPSSDGCLQGFTTKANLIRHVKTRHLGRVDEVDGWEEEIEVDDDREGEDEAVIDPSLGDGGIPFQVAGEQGPDSYGDFNAHYDVSATYSSQPQPGDYLEADPEQFLPDQNFDQLQQYESTGSASGHPIDPALALL